MSKVKSQREAVYEAIQAVTGEESFSEAVELTKEQKQEVYGMITEGFRAGEIHFEDTPANREKLANPSKLNAYVSGLVSNWMRKDTRLNGNTKYVAKNPGSRAGSTDPQLKALKALFTQFAGNEEKQSEIQRHIDARMSVVQAEKASKTLASIDLSVLPTDIIESLGLSK